jgi:hypothetical protein
VTAGPRRSAEARRPAAGNPNLEAAAQSAADEVTRGTSVAITGAAAIGIARQPQAQGVQGAVAGQPIGDAVRPNIEALLKAFEAATGSEKNRIGMQAVREVIRAYSFSTKGLAEMHFEPGLTKFDAVTTSLGDAARLSQIEFGPGSFNRGFEALVHVVAHELEHVAQNLIGDHRRLSEAPADSPVREFLAYSGSVRQVGPSRGRPGRGLLGEMRAHAKTPGLPPLPPKQLADAAETALSKWRAMSLEERQRYWPEFEGTHNKLLERIMRDAPPALRPPTDRSSAAFAKWRDGVPNVYDPLSPEYDPEVANGPWSDVRDQWKRFHAVQAPPASRSEKETTDRRCNLKSGSATRANERNVVLSAVSTDLIKKLLASDSQLWCTCAGLQYASRNAATTRAKRHAPGCDRTHTPATRVQMQLSSAGHRRYSCTLRSP